MKLATTLENGTDAPFEVRSESSSGVQALLTTLRPQETYKLVRSSSDTYLQHWVVMGNARVVSLSSDELIDNLKITIVCEGAEYRKVVVARNTPKSHTSKSISLPNRRPQPVGGESLTQTPNAGKPPTSGIRRHCSNSIRVRSNSPNRSVDSPVSGTTTKWQKGKLLGSGTFGNVYVGFNNDKGGLCAIKEIFLVSDDHKSKESVKQLEQEICVLSKLRHENIVQYIGIETLEDRLYIYLEFVVGGSIHKLLQEYGAFKEPVVRNYTRQILSGLAYLHNQNTVHRDIKGANILVDTNGIVKLADFGMAKHISAQSFLQSFQKSPYWMAPEVINHKGGYDSAVDIWSLGCTVLEMVTTKPPWHQYEGVASIFKIGNSEEFPVIPETLSREGKDFVRLCLQRDPRHRPTAAQLLEHPFVQDDTLAGADLHINHSPMATIPGELTLPLSSHSDMVFIPAARQSLYTFRNSFDEIEEIQSPEGLELDIQSNKNDTKKGLNKRDREPSYTIRTRTEVEIMDDGYKWRKHGQKAVKNSPHPRNYYRCSNEKCHVRKWVERAADDIGIVITTYEGTHNHPSPAAAISSSRSSYNFSIAPSSEDPQPAAASYPFESIPEDRSEFDLSLQIKGQKDTQPRQDYATATSFYPIPHSQWSPRPFAFGYYNHSGARSQQEAGPRGARRLGIQLLLKSTKDIVDTYHVCNPSFEYSESYNPKRYLTIPSVGVFNNGSDNENHDLILYYGYILANEANTRRYVVKDILGSGVTGQVAKCLTLETNEFVAVKVIKNKPDYSIRARLEIGILHKLTARDRGKKHRIVRSFDNFSCEGHFCVVFELLEANLYELLKVNNLNGISLPLIQVLISQVLDALSFLNDSHVIHCDIKPENILLSSLLTAEVKLIDFGSACMDGQTVYSYIQSRFYRSPEVVLGHTYSSAIDVWSLGCVAAELFLGLPLFPAQCEYDLLLFIIEKLGKPPPDHILQNAMNTNKYFKMTSAAPQGESGQSSELASVYQFLTRKENEAEEKKKPVIGKRYMSGSLEHVIMTYPVMAAGKEEVEKEMFGREVFIDFLKGLLEVDPSKRWTPHQASQHPFITHGPFTGPFIPEIDAVRPAASEHPFFTDGPFTGHFSPRKDVVPRARTSLGILEKEHNVSSGPALGGSVSSHASQNPFTSDGPFSDSFSPREEAVPRVRTPLGPTVEQNVGFEHGFRGSLSPHEPFSGSIDHDPPQWPLSVYMSFSDFLLLLCIFLEPLSNILTCLTDQGRLLVGSLIEWFRICIFERYGQQVQSRHKWRVTSRDLKTNRFLGQGCSGIIYETTWSGRENLGSLARKDFPAVQSDVFENEAARLVELDDHPNIVKSWCWTTDKRSCSLVMEYMRYDLYSVVQKRKGEEQGKVTASADSVSPKNLVKVITSPFEFLTSIDLILQIAIGMMYLHSRGIAHGDLKPSNVLVSSEASPMSVKLADFGLNKTKRRSTTLVSYRARCLQIVKWKAPELFKDYLGSNTVDSDNLWTGSHMKSDIGKMFHASNIGVFSNAGMRRADIYSFALTCSHILGVQNWDLNLSWIELRKLISCGLRPELPSGCPKILASMITSCWAADPIRRPTFIDICKQLRLVKSKHMRQTEGHLTL